MASEPRAEASSVGSRTRLIGEITGRGRLVVEGRVKGDIRITGPVHIALGASVEGSIEAERVTIDGTLEGDVRATGPVAVGPGARVRGKLQGTSVSIEPGARVSVGLQAQFELS